MSVKITKESYGNFGECLKMANSICEVYVTVELGPRVIGYNLVGKENIMFQDTDRAIMQDGAEFDRYYGDGSKWYIYGGHRLWVSPEHPVKSYYPDNDEVEHEIIGNTVILKNTPQKGNNIQYTITLSLAENSSKLDVKHEIKNTAQTEQTFAPWALTVMAPGGTGITPMPKTATGLLANRVLSLWDYSPMNDKRVYWGRDFITLTHDKNAEHPFKYGINLVDGWAAYLNKGQVFLKKFIHNNDGTYPDYGVSFESYTCAAFQEVESLGEIKTVKPGDIVSHSESWELFACDDILTDPTDENAIKSIIRGII
ncbi:MAG: hypothetical protein FWH14_01685 [Oscillospiraceae bacterium]|nr:hypothetical protein [Oscillospiraceae bacterium]